jgi:hypothetical protein
MFAHRPKRLGHIPRWRGCIGGTALGACLMLLGLEGTAKAQSGETPGTPSDRDAVPAPVAAKQVESAVSLRPRIDTTMKLAVALGGRVLNLRGKNTISEAQESQLQMQIASLTQLLGSFRERADDIELRKKKPDEKATVRADEDVLDKELNAAESTLQAIDAQLKTLEQLTGWKLVETLLDARCSTAICFNNGSSKNWLGIEPLVELPIGKSSAIGHTSLSNWVNNHDLRVDLAAGVRVWFFRDVISLSVYLSKPLNDTPVRLEGSPFVYPATSIRRPYPGVALGLLFDSIWLGFDRDELRNGDGHDGVQTGSGALNPAYPPNEVISSAWTFTVALQPVTAFRSAIGTAVQSTKERSK